MKSYLLPVLALTLLPGCSWLGLEEGLFPENAESYRAAPELDPIVLPDGVETSAIQPIYPIPATQSSLTLLTEFEVPRPTPLTAGTDYDAVRIQRLGDESWVLVNAPPGQLWPQVRAFLTSSGIGVASLDAQAGLIDTQFVQLVDQPLSSRFRFRVDNGVQRNTSELHVLEQNQSATDKPWPSQSDDLELERKMLRNIAQFIANSAESAPVSMMADRAMSDSGRIALEDTDTETRIRLGLSFARAWASANKGLPDAGFRIDDRDRSQGLYYLTFIGPQSEDDSGWFDWLWGGEDEHPLAGSRYQLRVEEVGESLVYLTLHGPDGGAVERRDQQALLTLIQGNIN